ncbi:MAG TPA: hypothetical protein VFQ44_25175 [Streptosporangiaceae bacterium]|nr:hypothetical protein [Streptosporangiaceae bacterium]
MPGSLVDESHLALAREAGRKLSAQLSLSCVYITGSLAAGLGNATSDVDIVAVADSTDEIAEWTSSGGFISHVELYSKATVKSWLAELDQLPYKHSQYAATIKLEPLLENLSRIHYAIPVLGDELLGEWKRKLSTSSLRQAYMLFHSTDAITYARDALGAVTSGDLLTAWDVSVQALRGVLLAVLASTDDLYYGRKWLLRRMEDSPVISAGLRREAHSLLYPQGGIPADHDVLRQKVKERMQLAGYLSAYVSVFAWTRPLTQSPEIGLPEQSGRSPWYVFARFSDTCFAGGPEGWRLNQLDLLTWLLLSGDSDVSRKDRAGRLARLLSERTGMAVSGELVEQVLGRLEAAGLIEHDDREAVTGASVAVGG